MRIYSAGWMNPENCRPSVRRLKSSPAMIPGRVLPGVFLTAMRRPSDQSSCLDMLILLRVWPSVPRATVLPPRAVMAPFGSGMARRWNRKPISLDFSPIGKNDVTIQIISTLAVIPAKAGIQGSCRGRASKLDSRFRENDVNSYVFQIEQEVANRLKMLRGMFGASKRTKP